MSLNFDEFKKCTGCLYTSSGCERCGYSGWLLLDGRPASEKLGMTEKLRKIRKKEAEILKKEEDKRRTAIFNRR